MAGKVVAGWELSDFLAFVCSVGFVCLFGGCDGEAVLTKCSNPG